CEKLKAGLQPKFAAELEQLRRLKVRDTGDSAAKVELWDWRYYQGVLKKEHYTVDTEALRVYFPYERCLLGMFQVYQTIFGLRSSGSSLRPAGAKISSSSPCRMRNRVSHSGCSTSICFRGRGSSTISRNSGSLT